MAFFTGVAGDRLSATKTNFGQIGFAHQVAVTFARGAAAFVEGPDHQALAAAAFARGENAFDVGGIFSCSALTLVGASRSTPSASSSGYSGPRKPIVRRTSWPEYPGISRKNKVPIPFPLPRLRG